MPRAEPPDNPPGDPVEEALPAGSVLYRVHSRDIPAGGFNPYGASPPHGGRFDAPRGEYAHLYAGGDEEAAVLEVLLRHVALQARGPLQLAFGYVRGKDLTPLVAQRDLTLVRLHGDGLTPLGQDAWLTSCDSQDFGLTRGWALAIRRWAPWAAGFVWRARRDNDRFAYVFFDDRVPRGTFDPGDRLPADEGIGLEVVQRALLRHQVILLPPA